MQKKSKRKNAKQLRMTPRNEINGEALYRDYMCDEEQSMSWSKWGNLVFSRGLTAIKGELNYGKRKEL